MPDSPTFHIGITMAGAVSAGAYTAGFMDYLLEALQAWEDKKAENRANEETELYDSRIPMHNVLIEAMGGASAGGMVSVISALSTYNKHIPVKEKSYSKTGNLLYDSWVLLDDEENGKTTFEKMLSNDDLTEATQSLLNFAPIDAIADKVFEAFNQKENDFEPNFIAKDLRVLVTLCSLKGIPFEIIFNQYKSQHLDAIPSHRMYEHMIIAHFKKDYEECDADEFLDFSPEIGKNEFLKKCTKGTGAFPLGLKPQHFKGEFTKPYIENNIKRNLGREIEQNEQCTIEVKQEELHFDFTNIDGGTINNEPFQEVERILIEKHGESNTKHPQFGTLMIDPFPNFYDFENREVKKKSDFQKTVMKIIPALYSTFREQVKVKRGDSFFVDSYKVMGFPAKRKKTGKLTDHPPLACGGLGGFGGFFDIEFRMHDFFLGRDNAKNIIRSFFSLEYDKANPHYLFKDITPEAVDFYGFEPRNENGKIYIPIIPDMNYIADKENGNTNPFKYYYKEFPKLNESYLNKLEPLITKRIKTMTKLESGNLINGFLLRSGVKLFSGRIAKNLTKKVMKEIKADFEERKMT
ncbi:MAG: hypothetical protein ACPGVD_06335 [Flavobacteriales bacterium]